MPSKYGAGEDSFGEGNGTPPQYSCLENPVDRRALQPTAHGVAKSLTRLSVQTPPSTLFVTTEMALGNCYQGIAVT